MRISVIIPSWADRETLCDLLPRLRATTLVNELVIVEASVDEQIGKLARAHNAEFLRVSAPSRGKQMNLGATVATGDLLVFLHADTLANPVHFEAILRAMADRAFVGGAFYRHFDERHPHLRPLEHVARFLTRNGGTLFGDQMVFVRREAFEKLGGFADIPLMEDVEFSRRLRSLGKVAVLDPPIRTSARQHLGNGRWRTTFRNALLLLLYKTGVSAERLHSVYYGRRSAAGPTKP